MLSEEQRRGLIWISDGGPGIGPAPNSQTDGKIMTASDRQHLLACGFLDAFPYSVSEREIFCGADGIIRTVDDLPYIPTHRYRITPAGRKALKGDDG